MKYTKNIGNKLKLIGFKLILDSNNLPPESDDDNFHYEIWGKGHIEVTVEHSPGRVVMVDLIGYKDNLNIKSLDNLQVLDRFLN